MLTNYGKKIRFGPARWLTSAGALGLALIFLFVSLNGFRIHNAWWSYTPLPFVAICLVVLRSGLGGYLIFNEDGVAIKKIQLGVHSYMQRFSFHEILEVFPDHNGRDKDLVQCLEIHLADDRCWLVAEISRFSNYRREARNSLRFDELIVEINRAIESANV